MATSHQLASLLDDDDDLISEMSMEEFQKELSKYPKVRDAQSQITIEEATTQEAANDPFSFFSNRDQTNTNASATTTTTTTTTTTSYQPVSMEVESSNLDFWSELKTFLRTYYGETSTNQIISNFQKSHENYLDSLSLDDIERLATKLNEKL